MSYQRAIEDVYWRHRIWPRNRGENLNPKPSLDAVMSQAQLEKKVREYLHTSQALEDYWQRPITAEQLQAEMDRMAKRTKRPEVLQELFDALDNDAFVIAECLARPALAERLLTNWYAYDQRIHGELKHRAEADLQASRGRGIAQMNQLSGKYNEIEFVRSDIGESVGQARRLPNEQFAGGAAALQRQNWTRSVKLSPHEWDETVHRLAAIFDSTGSNRVNAGRCSHGTARSPRRMSPWSRTQQNPRASTQRGGYNSSEQTNNAVAEPSDAIPIGTLSSLQEDESRYYATAVIEKGNDRLKLATVSWPKEPLTLWTVKAESHAPPVVSTPCGSYTLPKISDGGCLDDTWTATAGPPFDRDSQTAVWTGTEMIIWGGRYGPFIFLNTGGRYNPSTDTWLPISSANSPIARANHTAVWTGSEMIVWGGTNEN
ncbi:MAG: hypothetical protein WCE87_10945, partial [Candidatus Udaeobacter sp.]